jgi:rSAM/selenodomain-associated transferase 1
MKFPQSRILVFAKEPEPGRVKTRLTPLLGNQQAADLHARFVHNTLETVCRAGLSPVELWCSPSIEAAFFRGCRQRFDITLHQQAPGDLGQRMHRALCDTLGRSNSAVLVGTDCPGLCATDLAEGLDALARGTGVVLGPARDGGYYLVGLTQPDLHLFENLEWGTATIFADTVKRLENRGIDYHCLATREDVDTPEDYQRLVGKAASPG